MCRNERTLQMIEKYYGMFQSGMAPLEIAEKCKVSFSSVYRHLDEIAAKNGVPRDSLLIQPHNYPTSRRSQNANSGRKRILAVNEICGYFENVKEKITDGHKQVKDSIKRMTMYLEED